MVPAIESFPLVTNGDSFKRFKVPVAKSTLNADTVPFLFMVYVNSPLEGCEDSDPELPPQAATDSESARTDSAENAWRNENIF